MAGHGEHGRRKRRNERKPVSLRIGRRFRGCRAREVQYRDWGAPGCKGVADNYYPGQSEKRTIAITHDAVLAPSRHGMSVPKGARPGPPSPAGCPVLGAPSLPALLIPAQKQVLQLGRAALTRAFSAHVMQDALLH